MQFAPRGSRHSEMVGFVDKPHFLLNGCTLVMTFLRNIHAHRRMRRVSLSRVSGRNRGRSSLQVIWCAGRGSRGHRTSRPFRESKHPVLVGVPRHADRRESLVDVLGNELKLGVARRVLLTISVEQLPCWTPACSRVSTGTIAPSRRSMCSVASSIPRRFRPSRSLYHSRMTAPARASQKNRREHRCR